MIASNQPFGPKIDVLWGIAALLMTFNIINVLAWTVGFYVHPALYCIAAAAILLRWRASNTWVLLGALAIFVTIILGTSIIAWDARSIWFFHGKRIFLDSNLYSQLDKYPIWSHSDYPTLVPALAASVARAFGYWNETLPKLAVVLVLCPVLLFFARAFSTALFNFWMAAVLLISGFMLLNGYIDAILGLYCAAACVLLSEIYRGAFFSAGNLSGWRLQLSFALVLSNILLLKNEGLLAALMLWVCWLPQLARQSFQTITLRICISLVPFVLYFLVWRLPLIQNQISGDTFLPGIAARLLARLQNFNELVELSATFAAICGFYVAGLALIVAFSIRQKITLQILPAAVFVCGYWAALFAIYLITPHGLSWLLGSSADRTWMVANLCVVALGLYALGLRRGDEAKQINSEKSR